MDNDLPIMPGTCHIVLGKSQDAQWIAEVTLLSLSVDRFGAILSAVRTYNAATSPALSKCIASENHPGKLFFTVSASSDVEPQAVFGSGGTGSLSSLKCIELAQTFVEIARALHSVGLGMWKVDHRLCWWVDKRLIVAPAFWVQFLGCKSLEDDAELPPEAHQSDQPLCSERADVFAIAHACYEALADGSPKLPHPKLPGEWSSKLAGWDAALDAGLRVRPERRPSTLSEWMKLLPSPKVWDAEPIQQKTASPAAPVASEKRRSRKGFMLAALFLVGLLALMALILKSMPNALNPDGYRRGFADSVIRYANRNYENAKWKQIYSRGRLLPEGSTFYGVSGWDRSNFAVFGELGFDGLLLLSVNGDWRVHRFSTRVENGRFLEQEKLLLILAGGGSGEYKLVTFDSAGHRELGEMENAQRPHLLAPDVFVVSDYRYYKCSANKLTDIERQSRDYYVLTRENTIAETDVKQRDTRKEAMKAGDLRSVTTLQPGKALGLWSTWGGSAIVRYHDGSWYFAQELQGFDEHEKLDKAWFMDERNMVAIGAVKIARVADGVFTQQSLEVSGQEYRADTLLAVWGHSLSRYWVADAKGNVFEFNGSRWRLLARGPDFKASEGFRSIWASPEGSLIAVTEDAVFCFE